MNPEPSHAFVHQTHELLIEAGYKLVDDAWEKHGRHTYLHEEDAAADHVRSLKRILQSEGWTMDSHKLRTFHHHLMRHDIELEPGGEGATGHFLHHLKPHGGL